MLSWGICVHKCPVLCPGSDPEGIGARGWRGEDQLSLFVGKVYCKIHCESAHARVCGSLGLHDVTSAGRQKPAWERGTDAAQASVCSPNRILLLLLRLV
eukprot:292370-Rhodomonas_salina.2